MTEDIRTILKNWDYDPENSIRKVVDENGTEKIQVRVDQGAFQGILQMELDGRPDGRRPHNEAFIMDFCRNNLDNHISDRGTESGFDLNRKVCKELFEESRMLYERYVFLLQLQDYDRVIRDTERNMEMFRFINRYAAREKDRLNLEKWWPYILRIHAIARVMIATQNNDYEAGIQMIRKTQGKIENLKEVDAEEFTFEKQRSQKALEELIQELERKRPLTEAEKLKKELLEAIEKEEFEKAAQLRDRLEEMGETANQ